MQAESVPQVVSRCCKKQLDAFEHRANGLDSEQGQFSSHDVETERMTETDSMPRSIIAHFLKRDIPSESQNHRTTSLQVKVNAECFHVTENTQDRQVNNRKLLIHDKQRAFFSLTNIVLR